MRADVLRSKLSRAIATAASRDFHFLALSGGGQWGAFGAGFLKGWTEAGTRPAFDLVTGTSTGSMLSTFAFLGPSYDDRLGEAFLGITGNSDIFDDYFVLTLPFHDSLASTKPLERRLEAFISPQEISRVASEGQTGRQLFVGAVRLNSGSFEALSLTDIAAIMPQDEARRRYIRALMASTAIPVKFPPVPIRDVEVDVPAAEKDEVYVDGGVRRNIFFREFLATLRDHREGGRAIPTKSTIYCLVNGDRRVAPATVTDWLIPIAKRAVAILLREATEGNLFRICLEAVREQAEFRVVSVPPETCATLVAGSGEDDFDPQVIRCLYDAGRALAKTPNPWSSDPLAGSE